MARDGSRRGGDGSAAGQAEIDALGTVIASAAAMADRVRSEAAGDILRRALLLIRERTGAPSGEVDREGQEHGGFSAP